jgi:uncharacterized protein YecE (DUF72 family)
LEHYAARFATVEVNNAFYRLPEEGTFARWAARTPDDFVVAVKASRYLTHVRRLKEPGEPARRLLDRMARLGGKAGPLLLQLPPTLRADPGLLDEALAAFGPGPRLAVEFRHPSWFSAPVRRVLEDRGAALCLADDGGPPAELWVTAPFGYVRFHRGRARPAPCYGRAALESWADRLVGRFGEEADVFAYFNNDPQGCAPRDAHRLALALARRGRTATRTPAASEVPVG